ncbi:MAG: endonuclease/exonuclease/phosphatase family protein [Chitinophagaceae bacterium]
MSKPSLNKSRVLFRAATAFIALLFLLACLAPYINAGDFWFIAVLGLIFPFLFLLLILFMIIYLVRRSRWFWAMLVILIIGIPQIRLAIGFHFFKADFNRIKEDGSLRVMSWNVFRWDEQNKKAKGGRSSRDLMMDAVEEQYADVLCFQEFFQPYSPVFADNLQTLRDMGYPYSYFFPSSSVVNGQFKFGMAIVSRYPIIDSAKFSFGYTPHSEGLMYADIKAGERVFRVFSVHMESFRMGKRTYFNEGPNAGARNMLSKIKAAYTYRSSQALKVHEIIKQSPHPVILCGNLGDVPNSYAYRTVKKGLQDAFVKKGAGFGSTFRYVSPTLRLDYVLTDPSLEIEQFDSPQLPYSDHYPLIVDIR